MARGDQRMRSLASLRVNPAISVSQTRGSMPGAAGRVRKHGPGAPAHEVSRCAARHPGDISEPDEGFDAGGAADSDDEPVQLLLVDRAPERRECLTNPTNRSPLT